MHRSARFTWILNVAVLAALTGCAPRTEPVAPAPGGAADEPATREPMPAAAATQPAPDDDAADAPPATIARVEPAPDPVVLTPFPGVVVRPAARSVELEAVVVLRFGWLEQVVCSAGTREHESLLVPRAAPSQIHAALLAAGFAPGRPGRWTRAEDGSFSFEPPRGDALEILVRYEREDGETIVEPVRTWIREAGPERTPFPPDPWVFCGSFVDKNPEWMGPGEHYVADMTGSVVGLVTFGDEVIGFAQVIADREDAREREWEAAAERVPEPGTRVWLVIEPYGG